MMDNYYQRRTNAQRVIDPLIIKDEPFIKIVWEASKFGFGEKFVKKRIEMMKEYLKYHDDKRGHKK